MPVELFEVKCKSCGGNLNILEDRKYCYCVYCGTAYYIEYKDSTDSIRKKPSMRPIRQDEELLEDFIATRKRYFENFLSEVIENYELIDEGYCINTPGNSSLYFVVSHGRLFIVEQISQLHIFEGKITFENGYNLSENYLCSCDFEGAISKRTDIIECSKNYKISMNSCGRLSLQNDKEKIEVRLLARYIPEYRECMKIIENRIENICSKTS